MTIRQTILVAFVAALVSACCAVAISQAFQPQAAKAGKSQAVVRELKKANAELKDIAKATERTCIGVGEPALYC